MIHVGICSKEIIMDKFNDFGCKNDYLTVIYDSKKPENNKNSFHFLEYYVGMKKDVASVISIIKNYLNLSKTI